MHGWHHPQSLDEGQGRSHACKGSCGEFGDCGRLSAPTEEQGRLQQMQVLLWKVQVLRYSIAANTWSSGIVANVVA
jgi:hypothetical protein